jgi:hypothetical protein
MSPSPGAKIAAASRSARKRQFVVAYSVGVNGAIKDDCSERDR